MKYVSNALMFIALLTFIFGLVYLAHHHWVF